MTEPMSGDRTAWWGTCDDCLALVAVYPHPERDDDIPDRDDWEEPFPSCYVCDGRIDWGGSDPAADVIVGYQ